MRGPRPTHRPILLQLACLVSLALSPGAWAAESEFAVESVRPVDEVLAEAEQVMEEGRGKARELLSRGGSRRRVEETLAQLTRAQELLEDAADRGDEAQRPRASAALVDLYGILYWVRTFGPELPAGRGSRSRAAEAWGAAVAFETEHPREGGEVLRRYRRVALAHAGTPAGERARQRVLQLVGLADLEAAVPGEEEDLPPAPPLDAPALEERRETLTSCALALYLTDQLQSEDDGVRLAAAEDLQGLPCREAVDAMVRRLIVEKEKEVTAAILEGLRYTPRRETLDAIDRELVPQTSNNMLQTRNLELLAEIGTPRASAVIAEIMVRDRRDDRVVARGFQALEKMGAASSWGLSLLPGKLKEPEQMDRMLTLMGESADPRLAPYILPFLDTKYMKRRYPKTRDPARLHPVQAMIALGWQAGGELVPALRKRKYVEWAHYCLKQISGHAFPVDDLARWELWYEQEKQASEGGKEE